IGILALGIGVNLAEFQVFDAMIFHRLHVRDVDSILHFAQTSRTVTRPAFTSAAVDFYRTQSRSFAWLISEDTTLTTAVEGDTDLAQTTVVTSNYFGSLAVVPLWGRLLRPSDSE